MMGPWDPNWRPDQTGRRLVAIRAARRGALVAAVIFGSLEVVATVVSVPGDSPSLGASSTIGLMLALFSLPAVALLGAGLTSAALGPPPTAASAGLAMAVGVPVAAVTSAMIGAFILVGLAGTSSGQMDGAEVAGVLLRTGVTAAVRISPLIAIGSVVWVLLVRRLGRPVTAPRSAGREGRNLSWLRRGRGPRRRDG
jgi:hypothetical protein